MTVTKSRLRQWVPRMGLRVGLESVHSGLEYKYMGQEASQVVSKIIGAFSENEQLFCYEHQRTLYTGLLGAETDQGATNS